MPDPPRQFLKAFFLLLFRHFKKSCRGHFRTAFRKPQIDTFLFRYQKGKQKHCQSKKAHISNINRNKAFPFIRKYKPSKLPRIGKQKNIGSSGKNHIANDFCRHGTRTFCILSCTPESK